MMTCCSALNNKCDLKGTKIEGRVAEHIEIEIEQ